MREDNQDHLVSHLQWGSITCPYLFREELVEQRLGSGDVGHGLDLCTAARRA